MTGGCVTDGPLLEIENLSLAFGAIQAVDQLSFSVRNGSITSLIGGNGAGKTTVFNLITGHLSPDRGTIRYGGREIQKLTPNRIARLGVARTFQELRLFNRLTALDNLLAAIPDQRGENVLSALLGGDRLRREIEANEKIARHYLNELTLSERANDLAENLSYGQQKLLSLGRLLAAGGQFLLLDEPTSGLNPQLVADFCDRIRALVQGGRTVLLIEHNVDIVMALSDWIVVMHQGKKIAEGPPDLVRRDTAVMHIYLGIA